MTEQSSADLAADLAHYQAEDEERSAAGTTGPAELDPRLLPLAFLRGRWQGEGVAAGTDGGPDLTVTVSAEFRSDGGPELAYTGRTLVGDRVLSAESGFWRARPDGVEVVLAHPTGVVEVYVGTVTGARVELVTDLVARTASAPVVTGASRLYGLVEGRLLFAVDVASEGETVRPKLSGALDRV